MLVPQCWLAAVHEALQPPRMQHLQLIKHIPIRASNPSKGVTVWGGHRGGCGSVLSWGLFHRAPPGDTAHLPGCSPFLSFCPPHPKVTSVSVLAIGCRR